MTSRSTVVKAARDISEEAENMKAPQVIQKTTTSQGPGIFSTSSLAHVSDSIYTKIPTIMVYICSGCESRQLESCAAQLCNVPACVLGGVVPVLWVVVLVGLVCTLLGSVRVPHFPRCRCCMYLEYSVILVSPNLFLLLTQWLCFKSLTRLENPMGCCLSNKH